MEAAFEGEGEPLELDDEEPLDEVEDEEEEDGEPAVSLPPAPKKTSPKKALPESEAANGETKAPCNATREAGRVRRFMW